MEDWHPRVAVRPFCVRLLRIRRLRRQPAAGELHSDARSLLSYIGYRDYQHNNYREHDNYRQDDYREHDNSYSVIVSSRGKQLFRSAAR
jgi:hypothetical protein